MAPEEVTHEILRAGLERARETLETARLLHDAGRPEDSVSRAYYAAFFALEALLRLGGDEPRSHAGLRSLFGVRYVQPGLVDRDLARDLRDLHSLRTSADYSVPSDVDDVDARECIARAERLIAAAEKLLRDAGV